FEQPCEDSAGTRQGSGKLGYGERTEQRHGAAQHPTQDHRPGLLQLSGNRRGHPEDTAPYGDTDEDRDGIEQPDATRQALAPLISRLALLRTRFRHPLPLLAY